MNFTNSTRVLIRRGNYIQRPAPKAPIPETQAMVRRHFLYRREGFGPQRRRDNQAGDAVVGDELRQVAHPPSTKCP